MSDTHRADESPAPAKNKSGVKRKLALVVMAAIILVQGGVAGAYFLLAGDDKGSVPEIAPPAGAEHAEAGHGHGDGHGDHGTADDHDGHDDGGHEDHGGHGGGHGGHEAPAHEEPAEEEAHGDAHGGHGAAPGPGQVEVDLGEFSVSSYQEARGRTLFVSFHLYALLPSAREGTMSAQFEAQKHRIREKVLVLFRGASLADLSEPELGSLKGQTLETVNACFSKPLLEEVMFSDFVIVEQ